MRIIMIRKIIRHAVTNKSVPLCHSCMRQSSPIGAEMAARVARAARESGAMHPALFSGSVAQLRFAGLPLAANSRAGTFKRCRRRISGTYRTYGTYRTKVDRMANSFSADLLWCGFRPPIQRIKKILLITPHPRPTSRRSPKCPICPV